MTTTLNHTIVPSRDKVAAAKLFAELAGMNYEGKFAHFEVVRVNETLTLDFDDAEDFSRHHYAFHVSDDDFDAILSRVQAAGIAYGSEPSAQDNMEVNTKRGGKTIYFRTPGDGHSMEFMTRKM